MKSIEMLRGAAERDGKGVRPSRITQMAMQREERSGRCKNWHRRLTRLAPRYGMPAFRARVFSWRWGAGIDWMERIRLPFVKRLHDGD